jgi:gliding motility-associated lipoprotein GldH
MNSKYLIITGLMLLFAACTQMEEHYYQFRSFSHATWDAQEEIRFEVPVKSLPEQYNVFLEVRNTNDYDFRNIRLVVDVLSTDGNLQTDTIQANLADKNGKWYGNGISMYDTEIPIQTGIQYPDSGICVYTIRQVMRENPLRGIADLGLRVVKSEKMQ